jgi:hypothetical protein
MRQKTINLRNQGSFDKKFDFFPPDPKSHTQMSSLRAKNVSEKFSRLGNFKITFSILKKYKLGGSRLSSTILKKVYKMLSAFFSETVFLIPGNFI